MRVLVTGSRWATSYEERMWLYEGLSLLHSKIPITEIIEGGAPGFDLAARNWALWRVGCQEIVRATTVDAEWSKHGPAAGPIRNAQMADMRPDVVLACPGGVGTADMVSKALQRGLKVIYLEKMPLTLPKRRAPVPEGPPVTIDAIAA